MSIQNRLAKLEGINKSRSEKLIQAKAKAKQLFGVDDSKSLKSLWEKVSSLEAQLSDVLVKSNEHLEVCVTKIENKVCLSEAEIQLTDEFSKKINDIKSLIQNAVTPCVSPNEDLSMVEIPFAVERPVQFEERISDNNVEDTNFGHVPSVNCPQTSSVKFPKSSWELNQTKAIESELKSTGILSL
jgi:hypothetical protein